MAALSSLGLRADPLQGFNFLVSLIDVTSSSDLLKSAALSAVTDVALGGFSECSGLEMSMTVYDYQEGGNNGAGLRFPNPIKWGNITLKKGFGAGTELWDWHFGFVVGSGTRRNGVITLMDSQHVPSAVWYFKRGLPVKYSGPVMNATANAVAIESIEIAHEGVYQLPGVGAAGALLGGALSGDAGAALAGTAVGAAGLV
jgi:phage tail-like protein